MDACFSFFFFAVQQKGFVEKLVQRIVDNIEINVSSIHIRCVGPDSKPNRALPLRF